MTAFYRALALISAVSAPLVAASAANALTVAKGPATDAPAQITKINDDGHDYRYRRHYDRDRHVVHAPFTRVESGHRTVVDAPFAHVYSGRHGTHVVAPFVDLWR